MNKKLIAAAVSAAVMVPVAAHAGDAEIYGNITNSIHIDSPDGDGDNSTNIDTLGSRFGVKYSADLGNGLTANGKYEVKMNTGDGGDSFGDVRVATVGLSGGFGSVTLGTQWSSYFNTFGTLISPTYTVGHAASPGIFRTADTIKYANSFGPVSMELDYRINEGDGSDEQDKGGFGIGFTLAPMDNLTIAVAHDRAENGSTAGTAARTKADVQADLKLANAAATLVGASLPVALNLLSNDPAATEVAVNTAAASRGIDPTANAVAATANDDTEYTGISATYNFGAVKVAVGLQEMEEGDTEVDSQVLLLSGNITEKTSWLLGLAEAEDQDDVETTSTNWGLYHSLGGGVTLGYEAKSIDKDDDSGGDTHYLFMRVNF